jgi:peptide/nickel transport system substrate-binding protein
MKAIITTALAAALIFPPGTSRAADLRLALSASPSAMDPHFHNLGANLSVAQNMFDTLVRMDPDSRIQPGLAESWKRIDDRRWEFHLRPGVTFHSGAKLTAEDVNFSLGRPVTLVNSPAGFVIYTRAITGKTVVDDSTAAYHERPLSFAAG